MKKIKLLLILMCWCVASAISFANTIPMQLINNSSFADNEIYVAIVGQYNGQWIYYNLNNNSANNATLGTMSTAVNTLHKQSGDWGYANVFVTLDRITNKTIHIDHTNACRMFIGFRSPLYLHAFDSNGGYAGADFQNSSDPNHGIRWELVEFTYDQNNVMFVNTTRVDAFQYPMGVELYGTSSSNNAYMKRGELLDYQTIKNRWNATNGSNQFAACYQDVITTDNLGGIITQPSKVAAIKNNGYFDDYINRIWNYFSSHELHASMGDLGEWRGTVSGNVFTMTRVSDGAVAKVYGKPTTTDVIEGAGQFANGSSIDKALQAMFCGAINRGVIDLGVASGQLQNWGDTGKFFNTDTYNPYVKFFHQSDLSYSGYTYSFAYDDTFDQSSTCATSNPDHCAVTIGGFANLSGGNGGGGSTGNDPSTAAPTPDKAAANVKSIYSEAYTSAGSPFFETWGSSNEQISEVAISGNNAEKVENFGYVGLNFNSDYSAINMSDMDYLHIDIYASQAMNVGVTPISQDNVKNKENSMSQSLQAGWNSLNLRLSDFVGTGDAAIDYTKTIQLKLDGGDGTKTIYIDNVYFWKNASSSGNTNDGDYQLVWSDEFDNNTIGTNWNAEVVSSPSNNELEYYTDRTSNVNVENGNLVLTARRENYGGRSFTSGRVNSQGKVMFTHGKLEARIKLPNTARGLWPAFWMMGNDITSVGWPKCGEIDVMEAGNAGGFGGNEAKYISGAIHWGENWQSHQYWAPASYVNAYSLEDDYHLYTVKWDDDYIYCYVDNQTTPYFSASIGSGFASNGYMHKPFNILFNLAVGGDFPGITDANGITALPNSGSEAKMYVDYVRLYQTTNNVSANQNDAGGNGGGSGTGLTAAPTPTCSSSMVKSLYSDSYASVNYTGFFDTWGSPNEQISQVSIDGNNAEKVENFGYLGYNLDGNYGPMYMDDMEYLHVDIYAESSMSNIIVTPISVGPNECTSITQNLTGGQWNSLNLRLSDFKAQNPSIDYGRTFQLKFAGGSQSSTIYIDNIYFYKTLSDNLSGTTSCAGVVAADKSSFDIYGIDGRLVKKNASSTEGLQHGVYLINGKKIAIK